MVRNTSENKKTEDTIKNHFTPFISLTFVRSKLFKSPDLKIGRSKLFYCKKDILDNTIKKDLINTFESVKEVVRKSEGVSRAGLMLGLQELGASPEGFIGAYYPIDSNIIVVNKTILRGIIEKKPNLLNAYSFHVLLHEYIHSLGIYDESATRQKTYEISKKYFGEKHVVTELSKNLSKFFPNMFYPAYGQKTGTQAGIEIVKGFDKSSTQNYIT